MKHGRLIDADALYKNICDSLNAMTTIGIAVDGEWLWAKLNDAIENAQTIEPEQRWIPCSERLPKKEEWHYWVCTDTGYQCQCRWTNDVYGFGASDRWEWKIFDIPQYQKVVAWMPLPEPYREEGDE